MVAQRSARFRHARKEERRTAPRAGARLARNGELPGHAAAAIEDEAESDGLAGGGDERGSKTIGGVRM